MSFVYSEERHEYTLDGRAVPSLTQMLEADGLNEHLGAVPAATLEAKRDWGSRLHLALQKAEYGFGVDEEFKQHCIGWLDLCRKMKWGDPSTGLHPIWENCELPALARYEGFVWGFTPDRASPQAVVEIKGTYSPQVSHGIQVALQVIGMGYPRTTPRFVCYFDKAGIKRLVQCGPTIKRNNVEIDVFAESERIVLEHALYWDDGGEAKISRPATPPPYPLTPEQIARIFMEWTAVESSQISEVGYDAATSTLGIRFKPGKKSPASEYHYANVPTSVYENLVMADSVGGFFTENIKNNPADYPYTKVA